MQDNALLQYSSHYFYLKSPYWSSKKAIRMLRASSGEMTGEKGQKVSKEKKNHIKTSNTFLFKTEMWVLSSNAAELKDQDRFSSQLNYLWNADWILLCTQA